MRRSQSYLMIYESEFPVCFKTDQMLPVWRVLRCLPRVAFPGRRGAGTGQLGHGLIARPPEPDSLDLAYRRPGGFESYM